MRVNETPFEKSLRRASVLSIRLENEISQTKKLAENGEIKIAYELALQGKEVTIVEMKDDLVSQKGVCLANSSYLREWFALHEVPVYLETTLKEVKDGCIICTGKDGEVTIPCDSVICSAGYLPAPIAKEGGKVHLVGDCRKVGNLRSVIWRAYEVAMAIK